jgi:hypothetical protein
MKITKPVSMICTISLLMLGYLAPAFAAELHVTTLNDYQAGSLREAIALANSGDTIVFDISGTITLAGPLNILSKSLTITGPGAGSLAISGDDRYRVFSIQAEGEVVTISGVTIQNGRERGYPPAGGGIFIQRSTLTLIDSVVSNNKTGGSNSNGGGIYNDPLGNLTLHNTTVSNNTAAIDAGGIDNRGTLTLIDSTVAGNTAGYNGGGIYNGPQGNLTLTNSTVSGNTSRFTRGGGIYNFIGTVTLSESIVSNNVADSSGGGIYINGGNLTLANSTVSGNTAVTHNGGGIYNYALGGIGNVVLINSTIANNRAAQGGGGITSSGEDATLRVINSTVAYNHGYGIFDAYGTTEIKNSLLAGNQRQDLGIDQNCELWLWQGQGTILSEGYNLSDDDTCTSFFNSTGDLNNPLGGAGLDPAGLQDNGGPTQTIALLAGSIATDAIPSSDCAVATDQRGISRPQGDNCDIGAYELLAENTPPIIIRVTGPSGPFPTGEYVTISADFTDADTSSDTHTCTYYWGEGSNDTYAAVTEPSSSEPGQCVGTHYYSRAGVYTVEVEVVDDSGGADLDTFEFVVIYDTAGGFVTGGGWLHSPEEAYKANPALAGEANFGFVSKYKNGATTPTGNTQFRYKAGDLNFHSTSYDWLVIAGHQAKYKGVGTINGTGNYGFMLSAIDANLTPSTDVDLFRIRIWDKDNADFVVYDNQMATGEDADPTTAIGGGSIVIHKAKE